MGYKLKKFIQFWSLRMPLRRDAFPQHIGINNYSLKKRHKNTYQVPNFVIFKIRTSKINIEDNSHINISILSSLKYPRCAVTQKITNFLTKMFSNEKTYYKSVVLIWFKFLAALGTTEIWNNICLCKILPIMQNNWGSYELIY